MKITPAYGFIWNDNNILNVCIQYLLSKNAHMFVF